MKNITIMLFAAVLALAMVACDKKEEETPAGATAEQAEQAEEPAAEEEEPAAEEGEAAMVAVPAEGTAYDPAVEKDQIPDGAWICDMGTVHFAAMEKTEDGKCPECGMMLTKKGGDAEEGAEE